MYKGKKTLGTQKKCDNSGDSIYSLVGKWKTIAKKKMHKLVRIRSKAEVSKLVQEV